MQGGVYGRYRKNRSRIDFIVGGGGQTEYAARGVTDGGGAWVAKSAYDVRSVSSQIEYGYTFTLGKSVSVEPGVGFQYTGLWLDGFTEVGAKVLNLVVPSRRVSSERLILGWRVAKSLSTLGMRGLLEGRAAWAHDFALLPDVPTYLAGDPDRYGFNLHAADRLRDSGVFGGRLALDLPANFRMFVDVDSIVSDPVRTWRGSIGLTKIW